MTAGSARYADPHPDLMDIDQVKPCRSQGCTEAVSTSADMSVRGVPGFCRDCYDRIATDTP